MEEEEEVEDAGVEMEDAEVECNFKTRTAEHPNKKKNTSSNRLINVVYYKYKVFI